jgi:hypothetical protein
VEFGSAAALEIELGGLTPGTQHDQINIGGQATLNGTLDIELINSFTPTLGQQFQIMTFGSRVGMFPTVTGADFSPTLQLEPVYSATELKLVVVANAGEKIWGVDASGQASVGANWFGGVPPTSQNDAAAFTTVITANRTVTVDVPLSLRRMRFNDDNNYTIAGPQTITLGAPGPDAAAILVENANGNGAHTIGAPVVLADTLAIVQNSTGELLLSGILNNSAAHPITKSGPGAVTIAGAQTHGAGATLTVSAGTAHINTNAGSDAARNLTLNANSTTNFGSTQHLAALNIGAGATTTVSSGAVKNLVTNVLTIAGGGTPTGKLDVTNNAAIVDYPVADPNPEATIRAQILAGRGGSGLGKTWNGLGITSSQAAADPVNSMSVGYAVNGTMPLGALPTFRGQAVDATTVLARYTRTGDANLDGVVNNNDVTIVGANYAPGFAKPRWDLGDFDYNGFVDNNDVTLLGVYYNPAATPIPAPAVGAAINVVPEPNALLLGFVGTVILAMQWVRKRARRIFR